MERKLIPPNYNIQGGRIIIAVKHLCTSTIRYRARLIETSSTLQKNIYRNLHITITLSEALNFKIWSQDTTKAYIQGRDLTRTLYVKPTKDFGHPQDHLLQLLKPLSRITESGDADM